jgi:hypothetical protein
MAIFFSVLTSMAVASMAVPSPVKVSDTTDVFHEITDIGKRVRQQATRTRTNPEGKAIQVIQTILTNPPVLLNDTLPKRETASWLIAPSDSMVWNDSTLLPHSVFRNSLDSLYTRKENGTLQLPLYLYDTEAMRDLTFRDTLFYSPLFLPMIFTGQMLPYNLSLYPVKDEMQEKGLLIPMEKTFAPELGHLEFTRGVRRYYYLTYPDRLRYSVANFDSLPTTSDGDELVRETYDPFKELLKAETSYSLEAPGVEGVTIDRKYWVTSGQHSLTFAQNHFSENWHKGGTNNLNINSYNVLRANYKKNKVKFNNMLEWRLQVFNAPDDTIRHYRIGNDMIRYYGDFGVDALMKGWSYSMNVEAKSQLFHSYPVNSTKLRSTFLSPLYTNVGMGLKYNLDKRSKKVRHRRFQWELAISPISLSHRYVMSDSVNVTRYGIPEGEKSLLDIGTTISSNFTYNITRYIIWKSRLYYFTPYSKVVAEIENTLDMALSNAFSTTIYLHVRYDDSVPVDPKLKYWQFNQTLSFGLSYKW